MFAPATVLRWLCALALSFAVTMPVFAQEEEDAGQAPEPEAAAETAPDAEPAPDDEPVYAGVEEITITATRRATNIQDVPIAVTAITAEGLEARGISDVKELQQAAPSLAITDSNSTTNGGTIRIRGMGTSGNNPGLESAVGSFIDGVYRSRSGLALQDLIDVERVEILRGPQGTLFGKNTSAGAVNVVTKRPSLTDTEGFGQVEFGNFNHKRFAASFSAPIVDEVLGIRLSAAYAERDGIYEDFHSKDAWGERGRYTLRGQLLWAPTDTLDLRLIADFSGRDESCCPAVWVRGGATLNRVRTLAEARGLGLDVPSLAIGRGPDVSRMSGNKWHVGLNEAPFEKINDGGVSLEANWDLDVVKLTSITAWRKFDAHYAEDVDFGSADILHPQDPDGGGAFDIFTNFSEEIRAAGSIDAINTDWMLGFYGYTEDVDTHTRIEWGEDAGFAIFGAGGGNSTTLPPGEGYERDATIETSGWAIFTNNNWKIIESLDFTFGARYGVETKEAHSVVNGAAFGSIVNPASCANAIFGANVATFVPSFCNNVSWDNSGQTEKEWTYTFSLAYHITDEINTYVSYSRGYKAGGFNTDQDSFDCTGGVLFTSCPLANQRDQTQFLPEFSKSVEVGVKGTYLDGRARINVAAFHTQFEDFQLNTFTGLGFVVSNASSAKSRGAEIESFFKPLDWLDATLGITYADARYGDHVNIGFSLANPWVAAQDNLPCALGAKCGRIDGDRLTNAPAWTGSASINIQHTLPQTEWTGFASVNAAYRGRHNTGSNLHPYKFEGAHWFMNLTAGVRSPDEHWEASLWSSNLTNTYDRSIIFDTPTQGGTFHAYVNPPRMWGGSLKYNF